MNQVIGTSGNDVLVSWRGDDTLEGRTGNDRYQFSGVFGNDRIVDQSGLDTLDFSFQTSRVLVNLGAGSAQAGIDTPLQTGPEFQVNPSLWGMESSVTGLIGGDFLVAWFGGDEQHSVGIFAQRYTGAGTPLGDVLQLNTNTNRQKNLPDITALTDGGFVATWQSLHQDGNNYGIYGQRFNATGDKIGSEFRVNTFTTGSQNTPKIAALANGGFAVSYINHWGGDRSGDIYIQLYDAQGIRVDREFRVHANVDRDQFQPAIAGLPDGGFVVTWASDGGENWFGNGGIAGKIFAADGTPRGEEFRIASSTSYFPDQPTVTALGDGGFVVAWRYYVAWGSWGDIGGQRYSADGTPVGETFRVNTTTQDMQWQPCVTSLKDGGFVVTWTSADGQDGQDGGIYGQKFDVGGNPIGAEFRVNTTTVGDQIEPTITGLDDGGFLVSWTNNSVTSVFAQRFSPEGAPIGTVSFNPGSIENVIGGLNNDILIGSNGANTLDGRAGTDLLQGMGGNDHLSGGDGNDLVEGGAGNDTLIGDQGDDTLAGGDGDDFLVGGSGNDTLQGGLGNDTFMFRVNSGSDKVLEEGGGLDAVRLQTGIRRNSTAFFRDGEDLLIGYAETTGHLRVVGQFSDNPNQRVELVGTDVGLNVARTPGVANVARATGGLLFTAGEIDAIVSHIAGMASVTSIEDVKANADLLSFIGAYS